MKKISKVKLLKSRRLNNECTLKEKWVVVPQNMSYPKKNKKISWISKNILNQKSLCKKECNKWFYVIQEQEIVAI